jgi:hypothetical protein
MEFYRVTWRTPLVLLPETVFSSWVVVAPRLTPSVCPCCSSKSLGTPGNSTACGPLTAASPSSSPRVTRKHYCLLYEIGAQRGLRTGFGQHADYVFGWQGDSLQRAMDRCTDMGGQPTGCRELTIVSDADMNRCTQKVRVDEVVEGRCTSISF